MIPVIKRRVWCPLDTQGDSLGIEYTFLGFELVCPIAWVGWLETRGNAPSP